MVAQLNAAEIGLDDPFHPLALWYRAEVDELRETEKLRSADTRLIWEVRKS